MPRLPFLSLFAFAITVPLNVGNRFRVEKTITLGVDDEATPWDSENGVDAEAFLEKSEDSSPFAYAPSLYVVAYVLIDRHSFKIYDEFIDVLYFFL